MKAKDKLYKFIPVSIGLFFTTSIAGSLLGGLLDEQFGTWPFLSLLSLAAFYLFSWVVILQIRKRIMDNYDS
ncbi:MAG: hypothetical protein ACOCXP_00965 [Candidatus Dojkabacteria bacterium]